MTAFELPPKRRRAILISVMLAAFLAAMDQTVVGVALPRISAELGGIRYYAWVFTAYMLAVTIAVPISGKLGDLYGRRPVLLTGVVVFTLGSVAGGFAWSMPTLIAARAVQGLGAGVLAANTYSVLGDLYPPRELAKYNGMMSGVYGLASVLGPVIGGGLTDTLGWRWTFFVNLPLALLVGLVIGSQLPRRHERAEVNLDWAGITMLTSALLPSLLVLSAWGEGHGLAEPMMMAGMVGAGLAWVGFVWVERRAVDPVVPMDLFRNGIFSVSMIVTLQMALVLYTAAIYMPLLVQTVYGLSATRTGLVIIPMVFALMLGSVFAGVRASRRGRYKWIVLAGSALMIPALAALSRVAPGDPAALVGLYLGGLGFAVGLLIPTLVLAAQNALPHSQIGTVTALCKSFRTVGGLIGVAVFGRADQRPPRTRARTRARARAARAPVRGSTRPARRSRTPHRRQ